MLIPQLILRQLYTTGSLHNTDSGIQFSLKNRLADAKILEVKSISIDARPIDLKEVEVSLENGPRIQIDEIAMQAIDFPLRKILHVHIGNLHLSESKHSIEISFSAKPFGKLNIKVEDAIASDTTHIVRIPRDNENDYTAQIVTRRQQFVEQYTGKKYDHLFKYTFDPDCTRGNIENFTGVIQVPLGLAGPITIYGEHAKGDFVVPMATSEGTLVASYNRGIKVMNLSGGAKVTVVADAMQRAPVFVFEDARGSRDFAEWVKNNYKKIKAEAEATSSVARLQYIDPYLSNKFTYLRFNYSTGDAAGQNMVGRATFAACSWIIDNYKIKEIKNFYLESNLATDKKASQINVMHSRGKRVIAEATILREVLVQHLRVEPEKLHYHANIANIGAFLSGANNNGAHSPNAITAMFIATGQDVANVSESSAGILYTELTPEGNLYISLTIPSLIVATYGGGTGLPSQKECLELMDCYGKGKVNKLAEIVGAVALAGEISLGSAISSSDWVSSHESYGRNR
ncbi:MAG: hydroxymethylglutaryl-CoA reductase [Cyclobacteriaceae bacterium]|nr:hydroxymethylglutaryl-CoA reductase [Cyclobacteriaceae bacterium]